MKPPRPLPCFDADKKAADDTVDPARAAAQMVKKARPMLSRRMWCCLMHTPRIFVAPINQQTSRSIYYLAICRETFGNTLNICATLKQYKVKTYFIPQFLPAMLEMHELNT
jgi:hypothetical protein